MAKRPQQLGSNWLLRFINKTNTYIQMHEITKASFFWKEALNKARVKGS